MPTPEVLVQYQTNDGHIVDCVLYPVFDKEEFNLTAKQFTKDLGRRVRWQRLLLAV